ncbi:hypothetical protein ACH4E5_06510 [Streptomyces afghaniensis]
MKIRVRDGHPADVEWMSNNTEGWTVIVEKQEGPPPWRRRCTP